MKQFLFIALLTTLGLLSCTTAEIALSPDLTTNAMSVKGRNGWKVGQVINYGYYITGKVKRGWTQGFDLPFAVRFQQAKEKLGFTQYSPEGKIAHVVCVSKFKSTELPIVQDFFGVPLDYQNYFAGHVSLDSMNWDFLLHNPNGDFLREKASAGFAQSGSKRIEIQAIRGLKGQPDWLKEMTVYGHEFRYEGKVVAAVSTLNNGKVWIDESVDPDIRVVIAAIASSLLIRTDVESVDMRTSSLD